MWISQQGFQLGEVSNEFYSSEIGTSGLREFVDGFVSESASAKKRPGFRFLSAIPGEGYIWALRLRSDEVYVATLIGNLMDVNLYDGSTLVLQTTLSTPYTQGDLSELYVAEIGETLVFCHPMYETRRLKFNELTDAWEFGFLEYGANPPLVEARRSEVVIAKTQESAGDPILETQEDFFVGDPDEAAFWRLDDAWYLTTKLRSPRKADIDLNETTLNGLRDDFSTLDWIGPYEKADPTIYQDLQPTITIEAGGTLALGDRGWIVITNTSKPINIDSPEVGDLIDIDNAGGTGGVFFGLIEDYDELDPSRYFIRVIKVAGSGGTYAGGTGYHVYQWRSYSGDGARIMTAGSLDVGATVVLYCNLPIFEAGHTPSGSERGAAFAFQNGVARISSISDPNRGIATNEVRFPLHQPTQFWGQSWSRYSGFASACCEHQNRGVYSGYDRYPSTSVVSVTSEFENFRQGALDSDGFTFSLSSDRNSKILWLRSHGDLLMGTQLMEFAVRGQPLTFSSIAADLQHSHGGKRVVPELSGPAVFFVDRNGTGLRGMQFRLQSNQFLADDATATAKQLFRDTTILNVEVMRGEGLLVCRVGSVLRVLTNRPDERIPIMGWASWSLGATSITTAALESGDEIIAVVQRAGGYGIEVYDRTAVTDSEVIRDNSTGTISGLSHLEGETVEVVTLSGQYLGSFTVSGGTVSPGSATEDVRVGLPINFRMSPNPQDPPAQESLLGRYRQIRGVLLEMRNSVGGTVDGRNIPSNSVSEGESGVPFSGWVRIPGIGSEGPVPEGGPLPSVLVEHSLPFPFEISAVSMQIEYGK